MNLPESELGVLALDFIRIPVVGYSVESNFENLGLRAGEPSFAIGAFLDVWVVSQSRHRFQLPWTTRASLLPDIVTDPRLRHSPLTLTRPSSTYYLTPAQRLLFAALCNALVELVRCLSLVPGIHAALGANHQPEQWVKEKSC
jgi:hypothetical protein